MKYYVYSTTSYPLTDAEILTKFEEAGYELTDDPSEAIYVLRNGAMISGGFYHGIRSEDHRCIECLFNDIDRYSRNFWYDALRRTGMILLIPETDQALMLADQIPTPMQRRVLNDLYYEIVKE